MSSTWEKGTAPHLDFQCATMSPVLSQEGTPIRQQPTGSVHTSPIVTGTIEWPTIKNTQLTLFDLMDHLKQGLPPRFLAHWHHLRGNGQGDAVPEGTRG